jgi:hypothetical protein
MHYYDANTQRPIRADFFQTANKDYQPRVCGPTFPKRLKPRPWY